MRRNEIFAPIEEETRLGKVLSWFNGAWYDFKVGFLDIFSFALWVTLFFAIFGVIYFLSKMFFSIFGIGFIITTFSIFGFVIACVLRGRMIHKYPL